MGKEVIQVNSKSNQSKGTTEMNTTPEQIPAPTAKPWWKRKRFIIPGAVLAVTLVVACGQPTKPIKQDGAAPAATGQPAIVSDPPPAEPTYDTPKLADFAVKVKVTRKACFGSAGCNVTVKTSLAIDPAVTLDPSITYELTYEILGDEDGPAVDTMEITGDQYSGAGERHLSTSSSARKPTARITGIEEA